ncbi:hypothetical protein AWM76_00575 [Aerococcus viridans]|uniref:Uncharacterized protein n=1 Tax=Aerococcus viridans TaxID=1377 RepID=A0AAU8U3I5_9LACT|nr:hypothetical protein AWM76_00575 [Aerococcus viridans]
MLHIKSGHHQQQKWVSLATIYGFVAIKRDYQQQKWVLTTTKVGVDNDKSLKLSLFKRIFLTYCCI